MKHNFDHHVQKGNIYIKEVCEELNLGDDRNKAHRIMKAVLHALRDKITPQESLQLISQLPLLIKGIYVDGWKISTNGSKIRTIDEFIDEVKREDGVLGEYDFQHKTQAIRYIKGIFTVLQNHVSEGEIDDIKRILPEDLRTLFISPNKILNN